jgi:hypothetical protein
MPSEENKLPLTFPSAPKYAATFPAAAFSQSPFPPPPPLSLPRRTRAKRPEMLQEFFRRFGADTGYFGQFGFDKILAALVAVERDAEAVRFVAGLLDEFERFRFFVDVRRHRVVGKINFLQPFGDADHRHFAFQPECAQAFHGCAELAFAAVDDDELGQSLPFGQQAFVAPVYTTSSMEAKSLGPSTDFTL